MNIYEKLMHIQQELKAPKGQYNAFGKYKYRSCEDILESLKPVLGKFKLAIMISDDVVEVNSRNYIKATVTLINVEKVDEQIQATALAREDEVKKGMDGSQITGSSSSYARKYALNGLFAIDDTKDSDYTNNGSTDKAYSKAKEVSKKQLAINCIVKLNKKVELQNVLAALQKGALEECTEQELATIYSKLKA